jgi:serine/threonine protein kinase
MKLSADAILFGLGLMRKAAVSPAELAEHFRAVSAGVPAGADQLVALEERILDRSPQLESVVSRVAAEPGFVPLDCPGCGARLRARPEEVRLELCCPLCHEAVVAGRKLQFLDQQPSGALRAAEKGTPYSLGTTRPWSVPTGQRLAHFELIRPVGRGGAGRVYEARNLKTGRTVALKVLDFRPLESSAAAFGRLQREARAASSIVHDNIVRVYDLGVAEGLSFIEMEFVAGASLREHVRREGALPAQEACRLCVEALSGLARVHQERIVHGDVKPDNILIDEKGRARLTDFGLSRLLEETTSLSASHKIVGSPHFMAPEQWRGEAVSIQTDIYAMGLVLYYALTSRLPYEGESLVALMYKHLHEPLLEQGGTYALPDYLVEVIRRATEKAPEQRFESAEEFAVALPGGTG